MVEMAYANLAKKVSEALSAFADEVLAVATSADQVLVVESHEEGPHRPLGPRQQRIVEVLEAANTEMKTSEIAGAIDYDVPNTYMTLQALVRAGVVQMAKENPQRWQLRRRGNASPYLRMATLVRQGEWTTYGDISIAVRGDVKAARAVGRAAAKLPGFPSPHRVLLEGGVIPETWQDDQGRGPEECRRRLQTEGVRFAEDGRAETESRIGWDELVRRSAEEKPAAS